MEKKYRCHYPYTEKGTGIAGAVADADPGAAGSKRPSGSGVGACPMGYDTVRYVEVHGIRKS